MAEHAIGPLSARLIEFSHQLIYTDTLWVQCEVCDALVHTGVNDELLFLLGQREVHLDLRIVVFWNNLTLHRLRLDA